MGNEIEDELLKQNPRALYVHLPMSMREKIMRGQFVELHRLILDPKHYRDRERMTIVCNSEMNAMEIQMSNSAKECANWAEWQSAF